MFSWVGLRGIDDRRRTRDSQTSLGEAAADDFIHWFELVLGERTVSRDEHREMLSELDVREHDVSDLKVEVRELRKEMNERFDQMYKQPDGGVLFDLNAPTSSTKEVTDHEGRRTSSEEEH